MDYESLGKRIREERTKRRLTQEKMSERLEISDSYYGQIERGERHITLDTLVAITQYFGVTVDCLLSGSIDDNDMMLTDEWLRLTEGKTVKEKRIIINFVETLIKYLDNMKS